MRLLNQQEKESEELKEESRLKKKLAQIEDAVNQGIRTLNEFKEKDQKERDRIRNEHAEFRTELEKKKGNLEAEVSVLEERRREAMKPLKQIEQELKSYQLKLEEWDSNLSSREGKLETGKIEVSELADKYEERLGELKDFEAEIEAKRVRFDEEVWRFNAQAKYRESALANNHKKLRDWFEVEHKKLKSKKT